MQTYVAFLRGINVGGRIVKMADLKGCCEQAGFSNVVTVLQSGNIMVASPLTDAAAVREKLEAAISSRFNFPAKIAVRTQAELRPIADHYPFDSADQHYQHYIIFLRSDLAESLAGHAANLDPQVEAVAAGTSVAYWKVLKGMTLKSPFAKVLTQPEFKQFHTVRNLNTVKKLLALG